MKKVKEQRASGSWDKIALGFAVGAIFIAIGAFYYPEIDNYDDKAIWTMIDTHEQQIDDLVAAQWTEDSIITIAKNQANKQYENIRDNLFDDVSDDLEKFFEKDRGIERDVEDCAKDAEEQLEDCVNNDAYCIQEVLENYFDCMKRL